MANLGLDLPELVKQLLESGSKLLRELAGGGTFPYVIDIYVIWLLSPYDCWGSIFDGVHIDNDYPWVGEEERKLIRAFAKNGLHIVFWNLELDDI